MITLDPKPAVLGRTLLLFFRQNCESSLFFFREQGVQTRDPRQCFFHKKRSATEEPLLMGCRNVTEFQPRSLSRKKSSHTRGDGLIFWTNSVRIQGTGYPGQKVSGTLEPISLIVGRSGYDTPGGGEPRCEDYGCELGALRSPRG